MILLMLVAWEEKGLHGPIDRYFYYDKIDFIIHDFLRAISVLNNSKEYYFKTLLKNQP